ncbi:hypothetical protein D9M68_436930 [compost metagenome]
MAAFLVPLQVRVRGGAAEQFQLRNGLVDEALAQLVVALALDLPGHGLGAVGGVGVARAEHHQGRPPEAVDGVLDHVLLRLGAVAHHGQEDFVALALVEGLFLADADHGAGVGAVGGALQHHLVDDGGAIHQPAHRAHVGPVQRRVIEDARVLGLAAVQLGDLLVAVGAQGFHGAVEVEAVAGFVLDLGHQLQLALEGRGAGHPVAFRQHADDLGVGVLGNLADQGLPVGVRHPVLRLDLDLRVDLLLEGAFLGGHLLQRLHALHAGLNQLCVHAVLQPCRVRGVAWPWRYF